jgi:hypothetical protein
MERKRRIYQAPPQIGGEPVDGPFMELRRFSQRPSWPCLRKELACQFSEIGAPLVA